MVVEVKHDLLTTELIRYRYLIGILADEISSGGDSGAMVLGTEAISIGTQAAIAGIVVH